MAYSTVFLTEFDQELFDSCFQDFSDIMETEFSNTNSVKDSLLSFWLKIISGPDGAHYKIVDTDTGQTMGYCLAVIRRKEDTDRPTDAGGTFKILNSLYKNDHAGSRDWITDYIATSLLDESQSVATQANCTKWNLRTLSPFWESYLLSLGIKRSMIMINTDGETALVSIQNNGKETIFLSPWGWPDWKYEQ
jgi:hypothetical protein